MDFRLFASTGQPFRGLTFGTVTGIHNLISYSHRNKKMLYFLVSLNFGFYIIQIVTGNSVPNSLNPNWTWKKRVL